MSAVNAIRHLKDDSGTENALALTVFSNSVVEAFRNNVFLFDDPLGLIDRRVVSGAKSWQYVMWADMPSPESYTAGNELLGQQWGVSTVNISVDDMLVSHVWVPWDQMQVSHFETLGHLGAAQGKILSRAWDKRLFLNGVASARTASVSKNGLTVHSGGNRVTNVSTVASRYPLSSTGAANFRSDCRELGYKMSQDNVPMEGRGIFITPYIHQVLQFDQSVASGTAYSSLYSSEYQKGNDLLSGKVSMVDGGFRILGIVNTTTDGGAFPNQNFTSDTTLPSQCRINCTPGAGVGEPVAIAFSTGGAGQKAVGMVSYGGIHVDGPEYHSDKKSYFLSPHILAGSGVLHPWCAGTIECTAS